MTDKLSYYISQIRKIRRAQYLGHWINAKLFLLLSVLDLIDEGIVRDNKFQLTDDFIDAYKQNSTTFLSNSYDITPIWKPFYFFASDGIWKIIWVDEKRKISSVKSIKQYISYASLEEDFWLLLQNETNRLFIKEEIISIIENN